MKNPLVSIIIPIYNSEKYIDRCLKSIINQTYKNIEIILINDGSKDNSLKIIREYEKKYNFIKVYTQKNMGVAITRNKGIKLSTGYYIMFIDNDDYIDNNYIEKYVKEIIKKNCDLLIGGYRRVNFQDKILFKYTNKEKSPWLKYIIVAPWAKIYKRKILIDSNTKFLNYKIGEDVYFSICLYSKGYNIELFDYIGYNWYYNEKSISNTSQKGFDENLNILYVVNKLKEFLNEKNKEIELLNYYIYRYLVWYLLFSGKKSNSEKFMEEYNKINFWMKKNLFLKIKIPHSEPFKFKFIITTFRFLSKMKLVKLFSKVYCKGENA